MNSLVKNVFGAQQFKKAAQSVKLVINPLRTSAAEADSHLPACGAEAAPFKAQLNGEFSANCSERICGVAARAAFGVDQTASGIGSR